MIRIKSMKSLEKALNIFKTHNVSETGHIKITSVLVNTDTKYNRQSTRLTRNLTTEKKKNNNQL